jgi:hypothetical protein
MRIEDLFANAEFVKRVQRLLRGQARRFPALQAYVDDLVSSSLQDLWQFALRRPDIFTGLEPAVGWAPSGEVWDGVARVARTILSRRAIDYYRQHAAKWADNVHRIDDVVNEVRGNDPTPARQYLLRQMVQVCMAELARSSAAEREALWSLLDRSQDSEPLASAERQRISRLRKRLAEAIRMRLGESAQSLLASDLRDNE